MRTKSDATFLLRFHQLVYCRCDVIFFCVCCFFFIFALVPYTTFTHHELFFILFLVCLGFFLHSFTICSHHIPPMCLATKFKANVQQNKFNIRDDSVFYINQYMQVFTSDMNFYLTPKDSFLIHLNENSSVEIRTTYEQFQLQSIWLYRNSFRDFSMLCFFLMRNCLSLNTNYALF